MDKTELRAGVAREVILFIAHFGVWTNATERTAIGSLKSIEK